MPAFTMTDFLITMSVIALLMAFLAYDVYKESRRAKRKLDQWPSATHKKFDKVVNGKLKMYDPTEDVW